MIEAGDLMECHISDMDDEPPEIVEIDEDEAYETERQQRLDDAKLRNHKRLNRALLGIGATLDKRKWWEDEGVPGLAKRQV